jgi:RimJ/RimL family protein N-acetyltransferase
MTKAFPVRLRTDIFLYDLHNMRSWLANEHVTHFLNENSKICSELAFLANNAPPHLLTYYFNKDGRFLLVCDEDGKSVGFIKLHRHTEKLYEIVFTIGDETLWGRGIGSSAVEKAVAFAFFELRAEKIFALIYSGNERSVRTVKNCGFVLENDSENMKKYAVTLKCFTERGKRRK